MIASRRIGKVNTFVCSQWSKLSPTKPPTLKHDKFWSVIGTDTIRKCDISSSSTTLFKNSSDSSDSSETRDKHHKMYQEQLKELEMERSELFGVEGDIDSSNSAMSGDSIEEHLRMDARRIEEDYGMTVDERNEEREAIYNFSQEEKQAWGKAAVSGASFPADTKHSPTFMDAIHKAREAKAILDEEQERRERKSIDEIADKFKQLPSDMTEGHSKDNNDVFTHLNSAGDDVSMVDVGHKKVTRRIARARSIVLFPPEVMDAFELKEGGVETEVIGPKGPIFATARLAGIMGAKRTSDLIPLCHPLPLDKVHLDITLEGNKAIIECECRVTHKTGVEMEALAGASVAALTIYDMVKAVSHKVRIEGTMLISKEGGKRDIKVDL